MDAQGHAKTRPAFFPAPETPIPRFVLVGAGLMALATLGLIAFGQMTGIGRADAPDLATVASRSLSFVEDEPDRFTIADAATGAALIETAGDSAGFAVEAMRNLDRDRARKGVALGQSYLLALKADGRLVIEDPATGNAVDLRAFGARQANAMARFLTVPAESTAGAVAGTVSDARTAEVAR